MVFSVSTLLVTFTNFGQVTLVIFLTFGKPKFFATVILQISLSSDYNFL